MTSRILWQFLVSVVVVRENNAARRIGNSDLFFDMLSFGGAFYCGIVVSIATGSRYWGLSAQRRVRIRETRQEGVGVNVVGPLSKLFFRVLPTVHISL